MSRVPRITSPCPLRWQGVPEGPCTACGKSVFNLDRLDDAARARLLASCDGSICVSYRLPRAAALAASLVMASAALSTSAHAEQKLIASPALLQSPAPSIAQESSLSAVSEAEVLELDSIIWVGGVEDPHEAEWLDLDQQPSAPDLPRGDEQAFLPDD